MIYSSGVVGSGVRIMASVDERDIRELVNRILASDDFRRAPRLSEFLAYIVECSISSRRGDTTETQIGRLVFRRPEGYNPSEDSIVRSEARLLRQKLAHYFATAGVGETLLIEVPKGSYAAIIGPRKVTAPQPQMTSRGKPRLNAWLAGGLLVLALAVRLSWNGLHERRAVGSPAASVFTIQVTSSDPRLSKRFQEAKSRARQAIHSGGAVGDWYDAYGDSVGVAFNMRDVAHDASGAVQLGLRRQNRSMMRLLISSIAASRDWAGFWEMTPGGQPLRTDYRTDQDFRYCLPANFDLMVACYRQYLWTGDAAYLSRPFLDFYRHTIEEYVHAWDRDGDGTMASSPDRGLRGIPSYNQLPPRTLTGADLIAAQYAGYLAFAGLAERLGGTAPEFFRLAENARGKAASLRTRFNSEWWSPHLGRYYSAVLANGTFYSGYIAESYIFALRFELVEPGKKADATLDMLEARKPPNLQGSSYIPGVLFQYGRNKAAYGTLLELSDPDYAALPEMSFAIVDAVTSGLEGISPDVPRGIIATCSHLPNDVEFVTLGGVPAGPNLITVHHESTTLTRLTNQAGPPVQWKASFARLQTESEFRVLVDGVPVATQTENTTSGPTVFVFVPVAEGRTRTARIEFSYQQAPDAASSRNTGRRLVAQ